ncbi:kinesin-like protein [Saxophila tyrrhenica]|uniref:Kinesin-like protein n=1 Tax=Saxophila tyrrhenica TaxID=1690608 RepID=A0AAV9PSX7_9PEZI|nr:kinesin-like protein [Saxophila tyrrhenica]
MAPSTFASAAAGNNQASNSARDGGSEWSRRPNGATQTFRRPSGTSMSSANQFSDAAAPSQAPPRYVPPHRNGAVSDARYSKDQLLDLFRAQQSAEGGLREGLQDLYVGGWQPDSTNGLGSASWGRSDNTRDNQPGPDVCWDKDGSIEPLGLSEMDREERELFSTSVNTPLKPPTSNKENQQSNGLPNRKISISNQGNTPGGYGLSSPTATRGQGRRRETSESFFPQNALASPTATYDRNDQRAPSPPPSLQRRRTDTKDGGRGDAEDKTASTPFGSIRRNPTGPLSAGLGGPSSPWSNAPQSAGLSPMGSFGNFGLGQAAQTEKRSGVGSGRAESRFKNLLSKDNGEETGMRSLERKSSLTGASWRPQQSHGLGGAPLEEADEDTPSGSAALAEDAEISESHQRQGGFGTPGRAEPSDRGFGAFGMTSDGQGFGQGFMQQTPGQHRQMGGNEPMSPTDTNPYQSPEQQRGLNSLMQEMEGENSRQLPGLGGYPGEQSQHFGGLGGLGALPNLGRPGGVGAMNDRSQNSSVNANRGFGGLGGLGQLGGGSGAAAWPSSHGGLGTPTRSTAGLSSAFGGGIFATSTGDVHSPGLAGLGGGSMMSPHPNAGGSRMASMFPQSMQDQMRQGEHERDLGAERGGYQPFMGQLDQPRPNDYPFAEQNESDRADQENAGFGAPGQGQPGQGQSGQPAQGQPQPPSSASNQPPPPQQRTMVMPDRMRWIYRDPQGQTQGPWSGLEMHDWYKAGFFSPELLVKKYEDQDYEPLAQLIRRIGNSREPFLVPQIGIPHGSAATTGPSAWAGAAATPSTSGAQPPFANSFPSFGTTLTAEQQNALERRKQEEQYLMARQKEHLAQQQMAQRMHLQMQPGAPGSHSGLAPGQGQLQHQASAQSLHSQPSFGSMTSPNAGPFQPSPLQGPQGHQPGFFDNSFRSPGQGGGLGAVGAGIDNLGHIREEEIPGIMDRLDQGARAAPGQFGAPGQPFSGQQQMQSPPNNEHDLQVQQMLQDRNRLQQEQAMHDAQQQLDNEQGLSGDRLRQFQQLQGQGKLTGIDARFQPALGKQELSDEQSSTMQSSVGSPAIAQRERTPPQEMTLTEQVQKAASVQQSPVQPQPGLPQPFPPAPSQSPLPAPAAQRAGRQSVADQLQTEQRDLSQTPSVDTPSAAVAPWAKEPAEAPRGPSLKEIQEMEAKQAAEAEEIASAQRRAAFQKQMEAQQAQASIAPAPGLPASASWGAASGSPVTTPSGASAWAKAAQKPTTATSAKSMAQIQKEEEARKRRVAAAAASAQAATAGVAPSPSGGGKSYANLAGKVASPAPNAAGSAWTTVGAGGKPKTPAAPVPQPTRTVSSGVVPVAQPAQAKKLPTRSSTMGLSGGVNAQEEFRKWAVNELRPDLAKGIPVEEFITNLIALPPDADMLTEAVHGASNTLDSRHFAEEFIRRKRLADKGLVDVSAPPKSASPGNAGVSGWSEVAKKSGTTAGKEGVKEENGNGNFRVVAAKKGKGKR